MKAKYYGGNAPNINVVMAGYVRLAIERVLKIKIDLSNTPRFVNIIHMKFSQNSQFLTILNKKLDL